MNTFDKLPTSITFDYLQSIKRTWLNDLLRVGVSVDTVEMIDRDTYIAGSSIHTVMRYNTLKYGDVDIFCWTEKTAKTILSIYHQKLIVTKEMTSSGNIVTTDNINIICWKWDLPQLMCARFDFDHAKAYIVNDGLYVCKEMSISSASNRLVYNRGTSSPFVSLLRALKFINRGMILDEENLIKIVIGIRSISDTEFQSDLDRSDYVDFRLVNGEFNKEVD